MHFSPNSTTESRCRSTHAVPSFSGRPIISCSALLLAVTPAAIPAAGRSFNPPLTVRSGQPDNRKRTSKVQHLVDISGIVVSLWDFYQHARIDSHTNRAISCLPRAQHLWARFMRFIGGDSVAILDLTRALPVTGKRSQRDWRITAKHY